MKRQFTPETYPDAIRKACDALRREIRRALYGTTPRAAADVHRDLVACAAREMAEIDRRWPRALAVRTRPPPIRNRPKPAPPEARTLSNFHKSKEPS